ncbi:MAG: hypothetical protein K8L91_33025 [Anaerolineae bacterium]|nr:hypothetical protein [Anaerolineae bacterium]
MKKPNNISRIEFFPVREAFRHEALDFTEWLAENIEALAERIGLFPLIVEEKEKQVGSFRADLVCRDIHGNRVIIENQLERSDHKHLGQILVYLTNLDANTAVWITPEVRPEHETAIMALNKVGYEIYLVKLEAIRVDTSAPAPLFTLISKMRTVSKSNRSGKIEVEELTPFEQETEIETIQSEADLSEENTPLLRDHVNLPPVWCIYPRRDQETYQMFLDNQCIGLGFSNLGDLRKIEPDLESFRDKWNKKHWFSPAASTNTFTSMIYAFIHRAKVGDLVIYPPTWLERKIYVGEIIGDYEFHKNQANEYYDLRPVKWLAAFERDDFSIEALKGIRVNLAFFQVRKEIFLKELEDLLK